MPTQQDPTKTPTVAGANPASADYINKMYDASLESQKAGLASDYAQNNADLDAQQKKTQQQTDTNLNRTYVEAAKAARNYGEVQNAYGLSSGAMAQAKLAQDNTLNADMTALRGVQMNADAEIERQRGVLSQQYAAAIAKAQADNDLARAQALYQEAQSQEERLLQQQEKIADLFAQKGDYSYYQKLYGLTDEQLAALMPRYEEPAPKKYYGGATSTPQTATGVKQDNLLEYVKDPVYDKYGTPVMVRK